MSAPLLYGSSHVPAAAPPTGNAVLDRTAFLCRCGTDRYAACRCRRARCCTARRARGGGCDPAASSIRSVPTAGVCVCVCLLTTNTVVSFRSNKLSCGRGRNRDRKCLSAPATLSLLPPHCCWNRVACHHDLIIMWQHPRGRRCTQRRLCTNRRPAAAFPGGFGWVPASSLPTWHVWCVFVALAAAAVAAANTLAVQLWCYS
jgi:hypothetical protein